MDEFFAYVRSQFGKLSQPQVDGFNVLLAETRGLDIMSRAYILATAWHETARTMQPIAEYGKGKGKAYGKADGTGKAPYGRGYVQLTWRQNYVNADAKLGLGGVLADNYDKALDPQIAAKIIVRGMLEGWFTGKKLSDYTNYVSMRRIVNGTDRADDIASHAVKFEAALRLIKSAPVVAPKPEKPATAQITPPAAPSLWRRVLAYFKSPA